MRSTIHNNWLIYQEEIEKVIFKDGQQIYCQQRLKEKSALIMLPFLIMILQVF